MGKNKQTNRPYLNDRDVVIRIVSLNFIKCIYSVSLDLLLIMKVIETMAYINIRFFLTNQIIGGTYIIMFYCNETVKAFSHGAVGRRIDPSWWTH